MDADPDAAMLPLAMDAAVVRFRKLVAETIAAERPVGRAAGLASALARRAGGPVDRLTGQHLGLDRAFERRARQPETS